MNDNFSEGVAYRFEALHNFRDLGGLRAADGKNIRRGLLFRSDSFHEASAADVRLLLHGVGLTCIIDLRAEHEVAGEGTNPLIPSTVSRRHFPIDGGAGGAIESAPPGGVLVARYLEYLRDHAPSLIGAVRAIADAVPAPTAVHCRVGKDRTGVVIALILASVGVAMEDIAADYALTAGAMVKILARLRASSTYAANVGLLPGEVYECEAGTMVSFLRELERQHGGATMWLLDNGLPESSLAALRAHLIESTGEAA